MDCRLEQAGGRRCVTPNLNQFGQPIEARAIRARLLLAMIDGARLPRAEYLRFVAWAAGYTAELSYQLNVRVDVVEADWEHA